MPQDRKTTINNLIIVWQGQSWSVIAPDAVVLARFVNKFDAVRYAKANTDHISNSASDYVDDDFMEFREYIYSNSSSARKPKDNLPSNTDSARAWLRGSVTWLSGLILIVALCFLVIRVTAWLDFNSIVGNMGTTFSHINWLGLALLGLIVVVILALLRWIGDTLAMIGAIFVLIISLAICNFIGLLPSFLNWVF
jgi:hypothetical protein